jgi:hypothetical protein
MDNPETLVTLEKTEEVIKNGQSRDIGNIRENRRGNQEWTIQRHWPMYLDCPFLITSSVFSNVANISGLSILDYLFGFL